jgi:hypothetical protein
MIIRSIALKDAYPDITQKGKMVKDVLLLAAEDLSFREVIPRIERCPNYVRKISNMV